MSDHTTTGDGAAFRPSPRRAEPDAHGQAALLLAESTLHSMVEMNLMTVAQAVSIVRTACEVKVEVAHDMGESEGRMKQSINLLSGIERSLTAGDGASDGIE